MGAVFASVAVLGTYRCIRAMEFGGKGYTHHVFESREQFDFCHSFTSYSIDYL